MCHSGAGPAGIDNPARHVRRRLASPAGCGGTLPASLSALRHEPMLLLGTDVPSAAGQVAASPLRAGERAAITSTLTQTTFGSSEPHNLGISNGIRTRAAALKGKAR